MPLGAPAVILDTGDLTYPKVGAHVACWGYEKGIDPDRGPWRDIIYHIFDDPVTASNAGERSDLFMDALMGTSKQVITSTTPVYQWRLGHRYPGNERLLCRNVRARHVGANRPDILGNKLHDSSFVEINAHYEVPIYPLSPEDDPGGINSFDGGPYPFVTTSVDRSFRDIDLPSAHKDGDEAAVLDRFRVRIPEITYKFKYVNLPSLGGAISDALHGRVNAAGFLGRNAETLLFEAPRSESKISTQGDRQSDVEFQLTWFPPGWNTHMFPGDSTFSPVVLNDGTTKPYLTANFSILTQYVQS